MPLIQNTLTKQIRDYNYTPDYYSLAASTALEL